MVRAPYVVGDLAGASAKALMRFFRNSLSEASFSLTFGCRDAYAKPSIEVCWDVSVESIFLNMSESSSMLVVTGCTRSSVPAAGAAGTALVLKSVRDYYSRPKHKVLAGD